MSDFKLGTVVRGNAGEYKDKVGVVIDTSTSELSGLPLLVVVFDCGCVDDKVLPETMDLVSEPRFPFTVINDLKDIGIDTKIIIINDDECHLADETPQERVAHLLHETGHSN